jgi:hypothetical protein
LHGNIEDLDSLRRGAAETDGVIHLAFNHDFSQFQKNAEDDRKAIEAMGEVLVGSGRPFVVTSGTRWQPVWTASHRPRKAQSLRGTRAGLRKGR